MYSLLDTASATAYVADRRARLERTAHERRNVVAAITAALAGAAGRRRPGRDPAGVLVALPATAPATRSDDQTSSWPADRVA